MILLTFSLAILVSILIWAVNSGIKKDGLKWKMPLYDKNNPIFKKEIPEENMRRYKSNKKELIGDLLAPIIITGGIFLIYILFTVFGWA